MPADCAVLPACGTAPAVPAAPSDPHRLQSTGVGAAAEGGLKRGGSGEAAAGAARKRPRLGDREAQETVEVTGRLHLWK